VVAHLVIIERAVVDAAGRVIQKTPKGFSLWKRAHLPLWLVRARVLRRKSPIPLDATLIDRKEKMLGELRLTREGSLEFLAETRTRDLGAYRWRHPFLGNLDFYEWFEMIAAHQYRHTKQMKEIALRLPKVV
jgi:hypothetical protein